MTLAREFSNFCFKHTKIFDKIFEFSFLNHNEVDTTSTTDLTTSRTGLGDLEIQFDLVVVCSGVSQTIKSLLVSLGSIPGFFRKSKWMEVFKN